MPTDTLKLFQENMQRAKALTAHAKTLSELTEEDKLLRADVLRSAWMFSIGALDAYFCDVYSDIVAATMIAKQRQATVELPEFFLNIRFPVRALLEKYERLNWRWRIAAQDMMQKETVISLDRVQKLFNPFCRTGKKFFSGLIEAWISHPDSHQRLFGMNSTDYMLLLTPKEKDEARKKAVEQLEDRFGILFQRRHDCIHSCDRPRLKQQNLSSSGTVLKVIRDVEFLVNRSDEHLTAEIREFLTVTCKCSDATAKTVWY